MRIFRIFLIIILFLLFPRVSFAQSNYVLPYPSGMPGSFAYKLHLVYEAISKYWYFGDFGHFNYNLKMADKYLVEAKTLFEYKQYLLGYKALQKSNPYFTNISSSIAKAESKHKNVTQKRLVLKEAAQKHIETLKKMEIDTPDVFNWQPEKVLPTTLYLKKAILNSVLVREKSL